MTDLDIFVEALDITTASSWDSTRGSEGQQQWHGINDINSIPVYFFVGKQFSEADSATIKNMIDNSEDNGDTYAVVFDEYGNIFDATKESNTWTVSTNVFRNPIGPASSTNSLDAAESDKNSYIDTKNLYYMAQPGNAYPLTSTSAHRSVYMYNYILLCSYNSQWILHYEGGIYYLLYNPIHRPNFYTWLLEKSKSDDAMTQINSTTSILNRYAQAMINYGENNDYDSAFYADYSCNYFAFNTDVNNNYGIKQCIIADSLGYEFGNVVNYPNIKDYLDSLQNQGINIDLDSYCNCRFQYIFAGSGLFSDTISVIKKIFMANTDDEDWDTTYADACKTTTTINMCSIDTSAAGNVSYENSTLSCYSGSSTDTNIPSVIEETIYNYYCTDRVNNTCEKVEAGTTQDSEYLQTYGSFYSTESACLNECKTQNFSCNDGVCEESDTGEYSSIYDCADNCGNMLVDKFTCNTELGYCQKDENSDLSFSECSADCQIDFSGGAPSSPPSSPPSSTDTASGLGTGAIVGISVGSLVFLIIMIIVILQLIKKKNN